MVKTYKFFGFFIIFILALTFFAPKTNIYYLVEQKLQKHNLVVSNEKVEEHSFFLDIKDANLFFDSIQSAKIKDINIMSILFFNYIDIKDVELSGIASSFVPIKIENINIKYTIVNPLNITISADGEFGKSSGNFNILDKNLTLIIEPSKKMLNKYKKSLKYLNKNKTGGYSYEAIFN